MAVGRQRVTIVGTGCVGASIGMALRRSPDAPHLEVVGHDRRPDVAFRAKALGALDRVALNLDLALDGARLVVLAVPLAEMRAVLADVGRLLPPQSGTVITDTAPLKGPVLAWAEALLPPGSYFVGADPFLAPGAGGWEPLSGVDDARPDLFANAVYAIAARPQDHPSAVRSVAHLALALGATPLYVDPVEHDAVSVLARALPDLVATALFRAVAESPGWGEVRKAAGRAFATATAAAEGDAASRRMLALLGRETVLRGMDALLERLHTLREAVAQGDGASLETVLAQTAQARGYWMAEARSRSWEIERGSVAQENLFRLTLRALFGEGLAGGPPAKEG